MGQKQQQPSERHEAIPTSVNAAYGAIAPAFVQYTEEVLFGDVWRRSELSLRERSLITVAALMAGGNVRQLDYHLKLAKENGISEEELAEAITHLAFYTGWPRADSALQAMKTAFGIE
ncbi:carboxymuconolactone decarboxylase family protein [Paenibacillus radicis (ex Gao et al. 2016)]|nr:carboxymuconolactone decarboxylase family protein [Paenibacillus radicis (ex Gao et al. 2016)]